MSRFFAKNPKQKSVDFTDDFKGATQEKGKTGTAQKYSGGVIAVGKYVSSFVGYFPADNPKYLALVIIDEPVGGYYGSTVAAPYAKQVFEGIIKVKNLLPSN
ncbi:MAG: hypothetical protein E7373_03060 [Clostridiales bacterium]|nr:hypothetical protein [Clostridiales bacterium]